MWTSDVDTTAAMMKDTANTAPLTIISRLAPNIFTKTPTKIPIKGKTNWGNNSDRHKVYGNSIQFKSTRNVLPQLLHFTRIQVIIGMSTELG